MSCVRKKRKRMNLNTKEDFNSNKNNIYHYGNKRMLLKYSILRVNDYGRYDYCGRGGRVNET